MSREHNIIESLMKFIIKHAKLVILVLLIITAFFAYHMKDLRIYANVFEFAAEADSPVFVLTPEDKPEEYLKLKKIGTVTSLPDRGEVIEYQREPNIFEEAEFINPIPYVEKEIPEYTYPTDRNDNASFWDGYVIIFSSDEMFTPEVLNAIYEVRDNLSKRWELGQCLSPFDYVTVEKKGTRLSLVPIAPVKAGETWTEEDVAIFQRRLMNDSVAKDYLYSSDGTTIMIYYNARGLNDTSIAELDTIVNPLRQYGRVALNGGGLLSNAIYKYINTDLIVLAVLCFAAILIVFFFSFRTIKSMLIPASLSIMGIIWTLGVMAIYGYDLTIVTILTPCLVLTFGSSYSIHMISEYFKAMEDDKALLTKHYAKITKTIVFAMLTTVSGFLTQRICRMRMFREFGITISFGIFICAFLSFTYIPAILALTKPPKQKSVKKIHNGLLTKVIRNISTFITKYWWVMIIVLIILTVFFFCIKDDMGFDSNYMNYFPSGDPIVQDTVYFAKTLGGTDPYYFTIKAPNNEANFFLKPENLKLIYAYENAVMAADPDLVQVLSFCQYVSFLNEIYNGETGIPDNAGLINYLSRTLKQIKAQIGSDVLNFILSDDASEITLSMRHYDWVEQDIQTNASSKRIEQTLDYYRYMLPEGTTSMIWGGASSGLRASDMISEDQNKATLISMALILLFASLACVSITSGLSAIIPVLTAVMINYVFMWIFNIPFDLVTIGFSSVAIGAGVDDAIHFLLRLKERRKENPSEDYIDSIKQNIIDTGRPIILTTVSVDFGLLMLIFASFRPIKYFGALMFLALTAAMVATLLILPAWLIMFHKIKEKVLRK